MNPVPEPQNTALASLGGIIEGGPAMFGELMTIEDLEKAMRQTEERVKKIDEFLRRVMEKGRHYGEPFPGSDKLTLLKGGAELMDMVFSLIPRPIIDPKYTVVEWERTHLGKPAPFFHIVITTEMVHRPTGRIVGYGLGSCSSTESKYLYRDATRKCPACTKETIFKSKKDQGWFCWAKKGGCGAQFPANDERITKQELGKVINEDVQGLYNTILKMSRKRSHMDGVLTTCGLSGMFDADDDEDDDPPVGGEPVGQQTQGGTGGKTEDIGGEARQQLAEAFTKAGHKAEDVKRWIQETYGFDMMKLGFPKAKFAEILDRISKPEPLLGEAKASCLCPDGPANLHLPGCPHAKEGRKSK